MKLCAKRWLAFSGLIVSALFVMMLALPVYAADKAADVGGTCCGDLEERIAELEAAAARKGNRKVSLRIYGQVNKAILHGWGEGEADTFVSENSASESFVGFTGEGRINADLKAGFVLELGVGGYGKNYGAAWNTNDLYTRRSYVYLESAIIGKVSLGHLSQASDDITSISTANTDAVVRPLSVRPLVGPEVGEVADIFDGQRVDGVRYDSPVLRGFMLSASWANADMDGNGDTYDIALRYAGTFDQFKVAAGASYRKGFVVPAYAATAETNTIAGSASVMHIPTGIFVTAAAGKLDDLGFSSITSVKGWQAQGGVEERWNALGKTTVYGEFGELSLDGIDINPRLYGLGFVQAIDAAALDVYVGYRHYDLEFGSASDFDLVTAGARIKF